jgi:hypothetical protein
MFRECNVAPRDVRCWGSCKVPSLSARRAAMPSNVRYSGVQRMSRGLPPRSAYDPACVKTAFNDMILLRFAGGFDDALCRWR